MSWRVFEGPEDMGESSRALEGLGGSWRVLEGPKDMGGSRRV